MLREITIYIKTIIDNEQIIGRWIRGRNTELGRGRDIEITISQFQNFG